MSITDALASDHAKARQKIAQILARPASASQIYPGLAAALQHHNSAEEATLYRALNRIPGLRSQISTSYAQHYMLDGMLKRLLATAYNHPVWWSRFAAARRALEAHLAVEETKIFAEARKLLPLPQQRLLGARYQTLMAMMSGPPRRRRMNQAHVVRPTGLRTRGNDPYNILRRRRLRAA